MSDDYLSLSDDEMIAVGLCGIHFSNRGCAGSFNISAEKPLSLMPRARTYVVETSFTF
jgi:hypothetical protein